MPPIALIIFDAVMEISKNAPQLLDSFAKLRAKGEPTDADIASERAALAAIDLRDPLGKVPTEDDNRPGLQGMPS